MSTTQMTTTDLNAVKLWEKEAWIQTMQESVVGYAFNRGSIYFASDLMGKAARGDELTFSYVGKLTGVPIGEGQVARGNEEALDLTSHKMSMNVSRIPVSSPAAQTIEQQRTNIDFAENARANISKRAVELMDTSFFYQAAGADPTSFTINGTTYSSTAAKRHVQGHNAPLAPSTNRIIRPNGQTTDQALGSSDKFSLSLIDLALEKNSNSDQPIESLAGGSYDLFISPEQYVDLVQDTQSGIQWMNIEVAKITGGIKDTLQSNYVNGMICAGKYKNVMIYAAPRVAYGVNASTSAVITTVRRAVLLGKDAVSFASPFGGRVTDTDVPMKFFEELYDIGYYQSLEGRLLYGMKKMQPTGREDIGSFVISTYAATHA